MSLHPQLADWRDAGDFLTVQPFNRRVFYRQFGDQSASPEQTLLLLHGFPESSFSFHKIIQGMRGRFSRIIVFDMIGYGFSDKPGADYSYSLVPQADVALQVWQHLGVKGGHVVSHDMGTSVLTEIVARHVNEQLPAYFSPGLLSITFTNGSMMLSLAKLRVMQKLLLSRIGFLAGSLMGHSRFCKTVLSAHGVGLDQPQGLTQLDLDLFWQSNLEQDGQRKNHHIIRYLNDRRRYESTRWLPALATASKHLATHFCWGDADQVARVEMAREMSTKLCPDSTLTEMPGVGHFCQLGSPELWVQGVSAFYD